MKLERCLFPFAPSNKKLSSMTILLHLVVYAALIWAFIKAQEILKEDFESPPAEAAKGIDITNIVYTIFIIVGVCLLLAAAAFGYIYMTIDKSNQ
jgi:hypothetical protein